MDIDTCVAWALEQVPQMESLKGSGQGLQLRQLRPVPEFISLRRKEIIAPFVDAELEPKAQDYLLVLQPGQFLHRHVDTQYSHARHIRLNWFLSVAERGGELCIDTQCIKPEVDGVYMVDPSIPHHINTVRGAQPIVVISFGLLTKELVNV